MLFNVGNYGASIHTGQGNEEAQYTMVGTILNTTVSYEKRLKECGLATLKTKRWRED